MNQLRHDFISFNPYHNHVLHPDEEMEPQKG